MNITLIIIGGIYLIGGIIIAMALHFSEYKVPWWNIIAVGMIYPFLLLIAGILMTISYFSTIDNG